MKVKSTDYKIYGLIRVRDEEDIIVNSLDHLAGFCNGGIVVYDDCSTDKTVELCRAHTNVKAVITNKTWDENRERAEFENRAALLSKVKEYAGEKDWLVYVDADERIDFDWKILGTLPADVLAIRMKLFDFYITQEDVDEIFYKRKWMGPEYREIIFAFRNLPNLSYTEPDQREVNLGASGKIFNAGFVKHFGKALSVQRWERKCEYYASHFPRYSEKWNLRKGKAIHTESDFGFALITWEEKEVKGIKLTPQIEANSQNSKIVQRNPQLKKLKILLTNHHLTDFTGSELYTYTLAVYLKKFGHEVVVYSKYIGKIWGIFEQAEIRVVKELAAIKNENFDIAHVHHNINAIEVRTTFPSLPMVFLSHGILPFLEQPPIVDLQISKYLAVSEEVEANLIKHGVAKKKIEIIRNLIDPKKFGFIKSLNKVPAKALILSGRVDPEKENIIREACDKLNIACRFVGGRFGTVAQEEVVKLINESDIVFSLGRGAIESMFCGRIPIIYDYLGGDGMVTPTTFDEIKKNNFSGRRYKKDFTVQQLVNEIKKYDAAFGPELRNLANKEFSAERLVEKLSGIYNTEAAVKIPAALPKELKSLDFITNVINETRNYSYDLGVKQNLAQIKILEETIKTLVAKQKNESIPMNGFSSYAEISRLIEREKFDEAIREVEKYKSVTEELLLNPEIKTTFSKLPSLTGYIMLGLGEIETAENLFAEQLKITPDLNEAKVGLTLAKYALTKDDQAKIYLNSLEASVRENISFNLSLNAK